MILADTLLTYWPYFYVGIGWLIRLIMIPVVLRRQFTPGAALAWIGIIFLHPYIGLCLYFLVGESRLGRRREEMHRKLLERYRPDNAGLKVNPSAAEDGPADEWEAVARQAKKVGRMNVVGGNHVDFLSDSTVMIDRLVADIDAAKGTVHLLYYILFADETGNHVVKALEAAAARGVTCRLLADAFASRFIFGKEGLAGQLKSKGVHVAAALPTTLLRRRDLRNHRKLAIIDETIGYCGSQNLINADYGGRCGGPWYDLTGRFTGPIVAQFSAVFAEDWAFETNELLDVPAINAPSSDSTAGARMQLVPTGPVSAEESYRRVLLGAVQAARKKLIITTPYFVPDDPTLVSLVMAADRGVDVTLILPEKPDHYFTASAGRAHYAKLLDAGITIYLYQPGLCHTKAASVDETLALFGSANLDVRSFNLNFELSVLAYDRDTTDRLRQVQLDYIRQSRKLDASTWKSRAALVRYSDSAVSLLSPLL